MTDCLHNPERVLKVLERITALVKAEPDDAHAWAYELDRALNSLAADDFFGTERQNDPRGDGRDGDWSMAHVQGVDE